jgi:hypothetical protein
LQAYMSRTFMHTISGFSHVCLNEMDFHLLKMDLTDLILDRCAAFSEVDLRIWQITVRYGEHRSN